MIFAALSNSGIKKKTFHLHFKSQISYGFLITKELIFGFQILDLKDHFWASLSDYTMPSDVQLTLDAL